MQIKLKTIFGAALASVFVVAQARDFRSADAHPLNYPTVTYVKKVGEIVSLKTGGKYNIKVFGNSSLGSESDTVQQVRIGALDMARVSTAIFHGIVPESLIPALPFLFRDTAHYRKVIYGPLGDRILAAFEKEGYIGLALLESGARSFYGKKDIRTLADVKGMRIRVQPSGLMIGLVQAIGAQPMQIPYAEVYTALRTGLIDAAENNYPSYETTKHYEAAPVFSETRHVMLPEVLVFSKKVWDTLTREEQQIIRAAARESIPFYSESWIRKELESRKITIEGGTRYITDVHKPEFVAAVKPVWEKFAATPELRKLLQDIIDTK
ncbi:MAG: TRAP transporter substrate-binding protein [Candidatus Accumulibacter sp.]|nr:TRAP transporter substrate-binding protein [Accumulibacter sp.]